MGGEGQGSEIHDSAATAAEVPWNRASHFPEQGGNGNVVGVGRRRVRVPPQITQLIEEIDGEISEYELEDEEDDTMGDVGSNGVKHAYQDETWSQQFFTYDPKPQEFLGKRGTSRFFDHIPNILQLFDLFWPFSLLCKIVYETNRYATHPLDVHGNTMGGGGGGWKWVNTTIAELKAFLAIHMYMGMKRQPNVRTYWEKEGSVFHCPIISNIMSRDRFMRLRRCLHITNPATYEHI
jgi:hypothetical protein